jgi:hypothetical protein
MVPLRVMAGFCAHIKTLGMIPRKYVLTLPSMKCVQGRKIVTNELVLDFPYWETTSVSYPIKKRH